MIDWLKQDDAEVREESPDDGREETIKHADLKERLLKDPEVKAEYDRFGGEVLHEGVSKDEPVHVTWTAVFDGRREKHDRVFYLNALDASRVREGDYGPIKPLMAEAEGGLVKSRMHVKVQ